MILLLISNCLCMLSANGILTLSRELRCLSALLTAYPSLNEFPMTKFYICFLVNKTLSFNILFIQSLAPQLAFYPSNNFSILWSPVRMSCGFIFPYTECIEARMSILFTNMSMFWFSLSASASLSCWFIVLLLNKNAKWYKRWSRFASVS